jgi:hypothetical protein
METRTVWQIGRFGAHLCTQAADPHEGRKDNDGERLLLPQASMIAGSKHQKGRTMAYQAAIDRSNPTALLFLIDQSTSMSERMGGFETSKADFLSDVMNRTLMDLVTRSTKAGGVRDYFHVGVIGYGGHGARNALHGSLVTQVLNPISAFEANPLRVEKRMRKVPDGAGGVLDQEVQFPVWFEPRANGGTPMCEALSLAGDELSPWCNAHPKSFPPTILHITDGESLDGDPTELSQTLRQIGTDDGCTVLLNLHVSSLGGTPTLFPDSQENLPDQFAEMLFGMSSQLPPKMIDAAKEKRYKVTDQSRGYIFNAEAGAIVDFFDIGTRASQLR